MTEAKKLVDTFVQVLKASRINFERHSDYHVQVQRIHNFYPSKGTYYNSETGVKKGYPSFKTHQDFEEFIAVNTPPEKAETIADKYEKFDQLITELDLSAKDLAEFVSKQIIEEYGAHNFKTFETTIRTALKQAKIDHDKLMK